MKSKNNIAGASTAATVRIKPVKRVNRGWQGSQSTNAERATLAQPEPAPAPWWTYLND